MLKKAVVTALEIMFLYWVTEGTYEEPGVGWLRDRNLNRAPPECDAGVRYLLGCFVGSVGPHPLYSVALCFDSKRDEAAGE
jgi:hypothetical protein